MVRTVFPFLGGKSKLASWILEHLPNHECFVELFGSATDVLLNRDSEVSDVEGNNNLDWNLVQFFNVLRKWPIELQEWLEWVPYSRETRSDPRTKMFGGRLGASYRRPDIRRTSI